MACGHLHAPPAGLYCCGPSPVAAIRKGNIFMGYDTKFVFSEVNADKLVWLVRTAGGREKVSLLSVETMSIGKNISTKAVGQDRRSDLTHQYKFPEGRQPLQVGSKYSRLRGRAVLSSVSVPQAV